MEGTGSTGYDALRSRALLLIVIQGALPTVRAIRPASPTAARDTRNDSLPIRVTRR